MGDVKYVYIQNTHNAPITCNARGKNGEVVLTKKFMPAVTEKFSGKMLHSGYEKLTEEEYEALVKTSRTFQVYSGETGKAKLLVAHDELPAEAKTPHEALVDARKDARKAAGKIAELEGVIVALKAQLLDEQTKYNQLSSASTDGEKLKPLNDKIAELTGEYSKLSEFAASLLGDLGELAEFAKKGKAGADSIEQFIRNHNDAYKALFEVKKEQQ